LCPASFYEFMDLLFIVCLAFWTPSVFTWVLGKGLWLDLAPRWHTWRGSRRASCLIWQHIKNAERR
jgi:hypothetical protein